MSTQQAWIFRVGDGAGTEVFTALEGQYELSEFDPLPRTISDRTTIADANASDMKKYEFDKMIDGQEFTITADYEPSLPAQARLLSQIGVNAGVNCQFEISQTTPARTETWTFNVLVKSAPFAPSSSQDAAARDQINFNLKINRVTPTQVVA